MSNLIISFVLLLTTLLTVNVCSSDPDFKVTLPIVANPDKLTYNLSGEDRIIGGSVAIKNEFPGIVNLRIFRENVEGYGLCGGNILNSSWILTAAHCVVPLDGLATISVTAGDHYRDVVESNTEQIRNASLAKIIVHPDYNSNYNANDIALLELETPFIINEYVQQIGLANPSYVSTIGPAVVAGWGRTNESVPGGTNELRKATVDFVDNKICAQSNTFPPITESMVCASGPTRGVCNGDSGGPLMVKSTINNVNFLVGVTSFGQKCGDIRWPAVFQRVSSHVNWIRSHVDNIKIDQSLSPSTTTSTPKPGDQTGGAELTTTNCAIQLIMSCLFLVCRSTIF